MKAAQPLYQPRLGHDSEQVVGWIRRPDNDAVRAAIVKLRQAEPEPEPEGESFWAALAVYVLLIASFAALSIAVMGYRGVGS